jgi:hypothetical protein
MRLSIKDCSLKKRENDFIKSQRHEINIEPPSNGLFIQNSMEPLSHPVIEQFKLPTFTA